MVGRQDVLGQFSMVSMELFNIVEDIKKVNKGFVVYPRNVNAENAASELLCFFSSYISVPCDIFSSLWLVKLSCDHHNL